MPIPRVLRTSTFRLALIYLGVFATSAVVLMGFIYFATTQLSNSQTDDTIEAEITGLNEQFQRSGLAGLADVVRERSANQRQSLYLLVDARGFVLAGNLNAWPEAELQPGGWLDFPYQRPVGGVTETHAARARHLAVPGAFQLLVGRDVNERTEATHQIRVALAWALALTLALGLAGGVIMSRNLLGRVEAVNRTSREIIAGDLTRRVPLTGSGDELDQLAQNLNAMLDQIERLVTSLKQVTDNIAHDLRSPLNRLRSRLEVTLMGEGDADGYRDALQQTIEEADGLLATFNALLDIAKAEAGQLALAEEEIDAGALVRDLAELYEPSAAEKSITLRAAAEDAVVLRGDRQLLSQCLANLLDNAVKYTPEGGAIMVRAAAQDGAVAISVSDTGPGIPPADRERVQDRFVRLEASRNSPGSGLGLSLVAAVARLHGGALDLEDAGPGLRAVLRIPARAAEA